MKLTEKTVNFRETMHYEKGEPVFTEDTENNCSGCAFFSFADNKADCDLLETSVDDSDTCDAFCDKMEYSGKEAFYYIKEKYKGVPIEFTFVCSEEEKDVFHISSINYIKKVLDEASYEYVKISKRIEKDDDKSKYCYDIKCYQKNKKGN